MSEAGWGMELTSVTKMVTSTKHLMIILCCVVWLEIIEGASWQLF